MSVKSQYLESIIEGQKTIELRRRTLQVAPGTMIWFYAKRPDANVKAVALVEEIVTESPRLLWERFNHRVGVSKTEFRDYFAGTTTGCAVIFGEVQLINPGIGLKEIRHHIKTFHPPQFFKKLEAKTPELQFLLHRFRPLGF
jgi:predicted transcriptional regulator